MRRAHFPPERNHIPAHLTLFHHLPGVEEATVLADLRAAARPPVPATVAGIRFLGRGVALAIDAPDLVALRAELAARWAAWLTPQDRGWGRPHVTVQNKVAPEVARALHAHLERGFSPYPVTIERLLLWRYLGGPWAPVAQVPLR